MVLLLSFQLLLLIIPIDLGDGCFAVASLGFGSWV